jgi:hypothetical protein
MMTLGLAPGQMPDGQVKVVVGGQATLIAVEIGGKLRVFQQKRARH